MPTKPKKTTTKKSTAKKTVKSTVKKPVTKKVAVKKPAIKKSVAKKTTTKKPAVEEIKKELPKKVVPKKDVSKKYFEAVGRRKTSVARVRIYKGSGGIKVNDENYIEHFRTLDMQQTVEEPLKIMNVFDKFEVSVRVKGGGIHSQSEAVRHGIARALVKFNEEFRKRLKRAGNLKRDPRMKERRKFGLKKARKAPQWSKR